MSEMEIRISVLVAWFLASALSGFVMNEMWCDFEDIVLVAFVLLSLFLLIYIALVNYNENKSPLLHPKNIAVCGVTILLFALFRSMQKAGSLGDEVFLFDILTSLGAFFLNMTLFSVDNYIPEEHFSERDVVKNEIEREIGEGCEFDVDAFDNEKYEINISYSAQYFDKSQKDANITFLKGKYAPTKKSGWYYAEVENHPMRDYLVAENRDFDEFLQDLSRKNASLIKPIYMCSYFVNGWAGVRELCDKITQMSLAPEMHTMIYFSPTDIDDFIERLQSMKGLSEDVRGYFRWQFKGDFEALKKCKRSKKWEKIRTFDNSLVLKMCGKRGAIIKKRDYICVEIL